MSDNNNSPIDLGTLLINANDSMLSNKSQSSTGSDIKSQLVSKNPFTNLTNDQADALASVIKAANKSSAEEAFQQIGHDNSAALVALHTLTSPQQTDTSNNNIQYKNSINSSNSNNSDLQNKALNQINGSGLLSRLLGMDLNPEMTGQRMANLQSAQKITGQEPLQQKDIEQSALETQQKINQALQVPPTQAEKMQNAAAYAGYKTSALKDMLDNTDKAMSQQNEVIKNMQGYSSWFNKPFGAMPKEAQSAMKKLQQLQLERIAVSSKLNEHQKLLASGGSSNSPFIEGQVYTDANGNKATYKNGKFQ